MYSSSSNIYFTSLSNKEDSFPMWANYAKDETGCNIKFDDDFYDIQGSPCFPHALRKYLPSRYADQDYLLYKVQYIDNVESNGYKRFFEPIYEKWQKIDDYLKKAIIPADAKKAIRQFAADRLDEVRFLFKSSDYKYEGEVRIVYADSADEPKAQTSYGEGVPRVYVELEKELKGLTIRLGSRIDDATVDQIVTWLKHTGRVDTVILSERNRYTNRHLEMMNPPSDNKVDT